MRQMLGHILCMFWGFSSGMIISTGIVSFITAIGIIPRLAMKTQISRHYYAIGTTAVLAAPLGVIWSIEGVLLPVPLPKVFMGILAFAFGIFVGCLAVAIAEVMNVMPIMDRRVHIKNGVYWFILAFAIGKLVGAFYFWCTPIL